MIPYQLRRIYEYLKGEWFCRFFHKPLFFNIGGYGGLDVFNRRRKNYRNFNCYHCNNAWESERVPKWYKMSKTKQDEIILILNK